jgi:hypothetical protein
MCCANRIRRLRVLLKILMLKTGTGESLPFFAALLAIYTRSACYTVSFAAAGINAASCASNMVFRQISLDETRVFIPLRKARHLHVVQPPKQTKAPGVSQFAPLRRALVCQPAE